MFYVKGTAYFQNPFVKNKIFSKISLACLYLMLCAKNISLNIRKLEYPINLIVSVSMRKLSLHYDDDMLTLFN